jgi:hypothetical protein
MQRFRAWEDQRESKFFAADWSDILSRLAVWDALSPDTREMLVHVKTGVTLPPSSLGEDLERLERGRLLDVTQNRATARMSDSALSFFRLIRALERHDLVAHHDERAFLHYLHDHFTHEERHRLAAAVSSSGWAHESQLARHVASEGWPRRFLEPGNAFGPASSVGAATTVVRWFLENPEFAPLSELPRRIPGLTAAALASGLRTCFEQLVLFPTFVRPERTVVVGLWTTIAKRLAEPPPAPPDAFDAEPIFEGAYLVDDMTAILVAASSEPLPVRQSDARLFERTKTALEAQLVPLPDALHQPEWFSAAARINQALGMLESMKLLASSHRASTASLRAGRGAADWLALGDEQRLRAVLDWLRAGSSASSPVTEEKIEKTSHDDVIEDDAAEFDEYFVVTMTMWVIRRPRSCACDSSASFLHPSSAGYRRDCAMWCSPTCSGPSQVCRLGASRRFWSS